MYFKIKQRSFTEPFDEFGRRNYLSFTPDESHGLVREHHHHEENGEVISMQIWHKTLHVATKMN